MNNKETQKVLIEWESIKTVIAWLKNSNRINGLNIVPQAEVDGVIQLLSKIEALEGQNEPIKGTKEVKKTK